MNRICVSFCTKSYIKNLKILAHISKKLFVQIYDCFPHQFQSGTVQAKNVNLFVHTSISCRKRVSGIDSNLGTLYYEIISFLFLLRKFHLDILCQIVFNIS